MFFKKVFYDLINLENFMYYIGLLESNNLYQYVKGFDKVCIKESVLSLIQ